jgi:hypothetical protein
MPKRETGCAGDVAAASAVRPAEAPGTWANVAVHVYKDEGSAPFRDITRQVLFADPSLAAELRYFEMAAGGYSTLERHEHVHAVSSASKSATSRLAISSSFRRSPGTSSARALTSRSASSAWSTPPATSPNCRPPTNWRPSSKYRM